MAAGVEAFIAAARAPSVLAHGMPATLSVSTSGAVLTDVRKVIAALSKQGTAAKFEGPVTSDGDANSHIQGLAGHKDVFLLTHSDRSAQSGRILVVDRRPTERKLVAEFRLPAFATTGPALYHAGGCQVLGDVLAVPSESGQNVSVVAFFDVSEPLNIRELNPSLRIERTTRDAAAAGLAAITRNGRFVWLVAVYDSGTVDFYESSDLPGGAPFVPLFSFKVEEKHHQALLLLTDQTNTVFAVGLNRGFLGRNDLVLYEVDLVTQTMAADPDRRSYSPDGGSMRWGAGVEIAAAQTVHIHCTSRNYGKRCTISAIAPGATSKTAVVTKPSGGRKRKATAKKAAAGKASARRPATKKAASKPGAGRR